MEKRKWADVLHIVSGKNQKDVQNPNGKYPIYGSGGKMGYADEYLCEPGTTIVGRKGTINRPIYVDEPFWNIDTAFGVTPDEGLDSKYLFYFCVHFNFMPLDKSTGRPSLAKSDLLKIEMPVPSIDEQRRIVYRIEELFSELDNSVSTLQKTKEQLAVYRQAVLKEAFGNIKTYLSMDEVAQMIDPQPSHRTPPQYDGGIPYIGIGDIDYKKMEIDFIHAHKASPAVYEEHLNRYTLSDGDFVMGKIGTIGKPFRLPLPQNYTLSANVILIQPLKEKINPDYLFWQFSSPSVSLQLTEGSKATTQAAFGIKKARKLQIQMCSREKQNEIVEEIESRLSVCDSIEHTVDTALQQAEAMRQSILKQAFEGRL